MKRGFRFDETMSGTYAFTDRPELERPFSFSIEARADSIWRHMRTSETTLRGTLEAPGLAEHAPIEGTLVMAPLTRRIIRYEFDFTGDDGRSYRFAGQKDIRLLSPLASFTTLPASIYDADGHEVATALTRFDLRGDGYQFFTSWRLA